MIKLKICRTVSGDINIKNLGFCQCHEHLFLKNGIPAEINNALVMENYQNTLQEVSEYKMAGGNSIVDAQPLGTGRMADSLFEVSNEAKVNIIASTGYHKLIFYPKEHWIRDCPVNQYQQILDREINIGMYEEDIDSPTLTGKRAGMIKTAYVQNDNMNRYKKLLEASAEVAKSNGTPLMCHTDYGENSLEATKIILSTGIPPSSVIICHLDRKINNIDLHMEVADKGVLLDYDTIGRFKYHDDESEIDLIKKMIKNGFLNNILLSLDTTRERLKAYGGKIGLSYLLKNFIPHMKKRGVSQKEIDIMMIDNPQKALQIKKRSG